MTMPPKKTSSLDIDRRNEIHQVDERRAAILDAAEALFLHNGIDQTTMVDIARAAGINKVTLYRYFPDRDEIALEIHLRMLTKVSAVIAIETPDFSPETLRSAARQMIRNFPNLRDSYRFIGMFDRLYLDQPADSALPQKTLRWFSSLDWVQQYLKSLPAHSTAGARFLMVLSTVIWFLEKLALRGELTWSNQSTPIEMHLQLFEEMIIGYIDRIEEPQ